MQCTIWRKKIKKFSPERPSENGGPARIFSRALLWLSTGLHEIRSNLCISRTSRTRMLIMHREIQRQKNLFEVQLDDASISDAEQ